MRWIVIFAAVSIAGCLCCSQALCAKLLTLEIRDAQGSPVIEFTATVTSADGPSTVTCPGGLGCAPGQVAIASGSPPFTVSVTAGALSFSGGVSPVTEEVRNNDGCPGCPRSVASVVVR